MKNYLTVVACLSGVASLSFAASKSGPLDVASLQQIPVRVSTATPVYPPALMASGLKEDVTLVLVVDTQGKVSGVENVKASQPAIADAARTAVKKWLFQPEFVDGKEVSFRLPVTLAFRPGESRDDRDADVGGGQVDAAIVEYMVWPVYPASLRDKPVNGDAIVDLLVDASGVPSDAVVELASNPAFVEPAREAVVKWKFSAAKKNGTPAAMRTHVIVRFAAKEASFTDEDRKLSEQYNYLRGYDVGPKAVKKLPLVYPFEALLRGERGNASLMVTVTPEGDVLRSHVELATSAEFGLAARACLAGWKFQPATKAGMPVAAVISFQMSFAEDGLELNYDDVSRELIAGLRAKTISFPPPKELDAPLRPLDRKIPTLSADMLGNEAALDVTVEFIIDRNGRCQLPRVVTANTPEYGFAAATAAAQWKFEPPRKGGEPIDVRVRIPIKIQLKADPKPAPAAGAAPAGG